MLTNPHQPKLTVVAGSRSHLDSSSAWAADRLEWSHRSSSEFPDSIVDPGSTASEPLPLVRVFSESALRDRIARALDIALEDEYVTPEEADSAEMRDTLEHAVKDIQRLAFPLVRSTRDRPDTRVPRPLVTILGPTTVELEYRSHIRAMIIEIDYADGGRVDYSGRSHVGDSEINGSESSIDRMTVVIPWLFNG